MKSHTPKSSLIRQSRVTGPNSLHNHNLVSLFRNRLISSEGTTQGEQYYEDRWYMLSDGCDTIQNLADDLEEIIEESERRKDALEMCLRKLKTHHATKRGISALIKATEAMTNCGNQP